MVDYITVEKIMNDNNLDLIAGEKGLKRHCTEDMIARPGLEFAGFFDYFDATRVQLVGSKEAKFLNRQDSKKAYEHVRKIYEMSPPCIVLSVNVVIPDFFKQLSEEFGICLLRSHLRTTPTSSKLYNYLQDHLASSISVHGTFLDINGMGTMIIGKSGIGKSETSLDLIKRGHQLIADDLVEIIEKEPGNLIGTAPDILKRYMEIRGIGIVDVVTMFGAGAYRVRKNLSLVVELEAWNEDKYYDRLGLDEEKIKYFNTEITKITIPVLPGRTVSLLVESAAMNEKLKRMGHFAAMEFINKVDSKASGGGKEDD
ncbi:MAG TPA: HPr(Ser) kinase/phosphatase [Candidatus Pelethenecus faecipullorum]|uniref:HPr kinase/phosphorylase n=1 Tax=Candidatus Pelethenecus faecipullorum TaxID=2840900 RepID=A0A9D1KJF4_9MOLU|nr:HPr(Ser) kinase/phosphatase [Candidatus Pelethenecus faecipullorum]